MQSLKKLALLLDRMKKRPVLTPPVQRYHLGYFLARLLVSQGAKRFHRIDVLTGLENFPAKNEPMVMVGNHQNGMMDALNICGVMTRQFHWLTRADVFWNPRTNKSHNTFSSNFIDSNNNCYANNP